MAIISDFEEEEEKQPKAKPSASFSTAAKFSARFDPSSPLGFIEEAFNVVICCLLRMSAMSACRDAAGVETSGRLDEKYIT
ncbi:hypothetical protein NL676_021625 [Syzygium grande]|nr:hypothetical protein NL676_021625 [Syzygium grande]